MLRRRILYVAAALSLVLAACGGGDAEESTTTAPSSTTEAPATTSTTAPETTTTTTTTTPAVAPGDVAAFREAVASAGEFGSAMMEGSIEMTGVEGVPLDEPLTIGFSGGFDNDSGAFTMLLSLSEFMEAMAGAGEEIPPEVVDLFSDMEIRQVGDTAYMRFGFFNLFLGVETEWLSMPADETAGIDDFTGGFVPSNPTDFLGAFEDLDAELQDLGSETVRGVTTTHYRLIVDTEALLASGNDDAIAALEAQGPLPIDELPIDFWVGEDGLLYRYQMVIDGTGIDFAEGESFESMVMTIELYGYGEPVVVEAPDPANVTDIEEVGGSLFGDF